MRKGMHQCQLCSSRHFSLLSGRQMCQNKEMRMNFETECVMAV